MQEALIVLLTASNLSLSLLITLALLLPWILGMLWAWGVYRLLNPFRSKSNNEGR